MKRSYLTLSVLAAVALGSTFDASYCLAQEKTTKEEAAKILEKAPADTIAKVKRLRDIKEQLDGKFEVKVFKKTKSQLELVAEAKGDVTVSNVVENLKGGETEVLADIKIHLAGEEVGEDKKRVLLSELAEAKIKVMEDPQGFLILSGCGPTQRDKLAKIAGDYAAASIYFLVDALRIRVDIDAKVLDKVGADGKVSVQELLGASVRITDRA